MENVMDLTQLEQIGTMQNGLDVYVFYLDGKETIGVWADDFFNLYPETEPIMEPFIIEGILPMIKEVVDRIDDYPELYKEMAQLYTDYVEQNGGGQIEQQQLQ